MTKEEFLVLVDVAGIGKKKSTYGASYGDLRRFAKLFSGRKWVGLTKEEVQSIVNLCTFDDAGYDVFTDCTQVARIVEIRLKEKNT